MTTDDQETKTKRVSLRKAKTVEEVFRTLTLIDRVGEDEISLCELHRVDIRDEQETLLHPRCISAVFTPNAGLNYPESIVITLATYKQMGKYTERDARWLYNVFSEQDFEDTRVTIEDTQGNQLKLTHAVMEVAPGANTWVREREAQSCTIYVARTKK